MGCFFRVALNVGETEARNKPGVAGVLSENLVSPPLSSRGGEGENLQNRRAEGLSPGDQFDWSRKYRWLAGELLVYGLVAPMIFP